MEGLILLIIGCYAGSLVFGDDYWRFLNPKFKWLTGLTAAMFLATGAAAVWNPNRKTRLSRIGVFLLFISLLGIEIHAREPRATKTRTLSQSLRAIEQVPRVTVDGVEYIRINTAELFVQCENREPALAGQRFVTMGMVKRDEELDRMGQIAVIRTVVTCCLADAVGVGLRVRTNALDLVKDGQWVEVYYTVEEMIPPSAEIRLQFEGVRVVALSQSCELVPIHIKAISEPDIPYIFEIRSGEPYAY